MSTKKHRTKRVPKYRKMNVTLSTGELTLYAGQKVLSALREVTTDMTLYKGVRLGEVMTAVYEQGLKDGRKEASSSSTRLRNRSSIYHRADPGNNGPHT